MAPGARAQSRRAGPGRRVWDGVVPGIGLAAWRQCAGMQPAEQAAGPGGDARVGQVDWHAVNPPVEPQPATPGIGGQPGDETPARAGNAGRQPDAGRFQVRGQLRLAARRCLVGFPEQLLDRETISAQVKAPDPSHRTARHRADRSARHLRKPEGSADPADCRRASADHTPSQPAHTPKPPALPALCQVSPSLGWRPVEGPVAIPAGLDGMAARTRTGISPHHGEQRMVGKGG
jgi:hypothetical protein